MTLIFAETSGCSFTSTWCRSAQLLNGVAAAIFTAPVGWIASRFGKRNFFLVSLTGFTVTSMMCGAAQSLEQMILFRLLQGCFGAALSPLSQAVMLDLYPPQKRGNIMAIWGMGVMLGPILGPTLGGYLTDAYNWRWVFYVNVPFGIASVVGIWMFFKDSPRDSSLRFDWFGFGALAIGLGALQLMLDRGTGKGWFGSAEIILECLIAGVGLYLFVVHMLTAKTPFIPPKIFNDRNFLSALFLMFVTGAILLASSALLPPYLQNLAGYSVFDTGMLMAPRGFGTMFAMMFAGRLAMRIDPRILMTCGIGTSALVDVGHVRLDAADRYDDFDRRDVSAGCRNGICVRAAEPDRFRNSGAELSHRWFRAYEFDAQHRQRNRRVGNDDRTGLQRAGLALPTGRLRVRFQPRTRCECAVDDDEPTTSFRLGQSERHDRNAGRGHRLLERFSLHDICQPSGLSDHMVHEKPNFSAQQPAHVEVME